MKSLFDQVVFRFGPRCWEMKADKSDRPSPNNSLVSRAYSDSLQASTFTWSLVPRGKREESVFKVISGGAVSQGGHGSKGWVVFTSLRAKKTAQTKPCKTPLHTNQLKKPAWLAKSDYLKQNKKKSHKSIIWDQPWVPKLQVFFFFFPSRGGTSRTAVAAHVGTLGVFRLQLHVHRADWHESMSAMVYFTPPDAPKHSLR